MKLCRPRYLREQMRERVEKGERPTKVQEHQRREVLTRAILLHKLKENHS